MSELRFDGLVAIVTGAGRGIGAAYAELLAARGAQVVVNDIGVGQDGAGADSGPATEVVARIRQAGGKAEADLSDITSEDGAKALVATAITAFGRLDIVINNAGIHWTDEFPNIGPDELSKQFDVHVLGSFFVTQAAWSHLTKRGQGRVVMTTSTGALGSDVYTAYGTAKAAVAGLGRALAQSGAPHGIKVNIIAPLAMSRMMIQHTGRTEVPEDPERAPSMVAALVALLCHPSCEVNGETYVAGMRRYSRLVVAETVGFTSQSQTITPEDVLANWDSINDMSEFNVATDTNSYSNTYEQLRGGGDDTP